MGYLWDLLRCTVLKEVVVVRLSSFRAVSPVWSPAAHITVNQIQDSNSPLSELHRYTTLTMWELGSIELRRSECLDVLVEINWVQLFWHSSRSTVKLLCCSVSLFWNELVKKTTETFLFFCVHLGIPAKYDKFNPDHRKQGQIWYWQLVFCYF